MSSKNNPEARGKVTLKRKLGGKEVTPVKYKNLELNLNYIAACYEDGSFAINPATELPYAYKSV